MVNRKQNFIINLGLVGCQYWLTFARHDRLYLLSSWYKKSIHSIHNTADLQECTTLSYYQRCCMVETLIQLFTLIYRRTLTS